MSGEMLVIYFVREVNHVIMAATLDSRQIYHFKLLRINCSSTRVMASVYIFSRELRRWILYRRPAQLTHSETTKIKSECHERNVCRAK